MKKRFVGIALALLAATAFAAGRRTQTVIGTFENAGDKLHFWISTSEDGDRVAGLSARDEYGANKVNYVLNEKDIETLEKLLAETKAELSKPSAAE